jgi:hypothetical protein
MPALAHTRINDNGRKCNGNDPVLFGAFGAGRKEALGGWCTRRTEGRRDEGGRERIANTRIKENERRWKGNDLVLFVHLERDGGKRWEDGAREGRRDGGTREEGKEFLKSILYSPSWR